MRVQTACTGPFRLFLLVLQKRDLLRVFNLALVDLRHMLSCCILAAILDFGIFLFRFNEVKQVAATS